MKICKLLHHRGATIEQSADIDVKPSIAPDQFTNTACKAARADRAYLQAEGTQQTTDLVLVVSKLVDEELSRNQ